MAEATTQFEEYPHTPPPNWKTKFSRGYKDHTHPDAVNESDRPTHFWYLWCTVCGDYATYEDRKTKAYMNCNMGGDCVEKIYDCGHCRESTCINPKQEVTSVCRGCH